jgi:hypothetical protein
LRWFAGLWLLCASATLACGQGTIVFHNTGGGPVLVSESRSIILDAGLQQPRLVFDFGFATDETSSPGSFLDSFTVTIQSSDQSFSAVYLTADANGIAWAPQTPGGLTIDPGSIFASSIGYPTLQPVLGSQTALEVSAPIPVQFLGGPVNVYFDLFDNQDVKISQGWFSNLGVASVPEPQVWTLMLGAGALFWICKGPRPRG